MKSKSNGIAVSLLKGAIAGAAGMWGMDQLSWYLYRREDPAAHRKEKEAQIGGMYTTHVAAKKLLDPFGISLSDKQFNAAGKVVQYGLGMAPGALYAVYRDRMKVNSSLKGLLYGFGLFVVVDEVVMPLLGLASGPRAYPWQAHVRGLVDHLALGVTTDAALNALNRAAS
jgi:hypothetical protein